MRPPSADAQTYTPAYCSTDGCRRAPQTGWAMCVDCLEVAFFGNSILTAPSRAGDLTLRGLGAGAGEPDRRSTSAPWLARPGVQVDNAPAASPRGRSQSAYPGDWEENELRLASGDR